MRTIKTHSVDSSEPRDLSLLTLDPDDCFGREWENTAPECLRCSEYETCMVISLDVNKEKIKKLKKGKNFLDEIDWEAVPWDDFVLIVRDSPKEVSLEEIRKTVSELSRCDDKLTVNMKVQQWVFHNGLKIEDGCLY